MTIVLAQPMKSTMGRTNAKYVAHFDRSSATLDPLLLSHFKICVYFSFDVFPLDLISLYFLSKI